MDRNDHIDWTATSLIEEAYQVRAALDVIAYGPNREKQMQTRLAAVAFELLCRQNENHGEDPRTAFAFSDVYWFGEHTPAPGLELAHQSIGFGG